MFDLLGAEIGSAPRRAAIKQALIQLLAGMGERAAGWDEAFRRHDQDWSALLRCLKGSHFGRSCYRLSNWPYNIKVKIAKYLADHWAGPV